MLENDNQIDIFGNDTDNWKIGKQISWNGMKFSIAPFFERLVCSNGNTAEQYGFKSNISNKKFNLEKINNILEKEVTYNSDSLNEYLIDAVNHLKSSNVSVREFYESRRFFNDVDHQDILKNYFDDTQINRAYGCIAVEKPALWQKTADTGINAYDFFNNVTWVATHNDQTKLSDREKIDLQIKSSNLLFAELLDLEQVAPKVKFTR